MRYLVILLTLSLQMLSAGQKVTKPEDPSQPTPIKTEKQAEQTQVDNFDGDQDPAG